MNTPGFVGIIPISSRILLDMVCCEYDPEDQPRCITTCDEVLSPSEPGLMGVIRVFIPMWITVRVVRPLGGTDVSRLYGDTNFLQSTNASCLLEMSRSLEALVDEIEQSNHIYPRLVYMPGMWEVHGDKIHGEQCVCLWVADAPFKSQEAVVDDLSFYVVAPDARA